MGRTLRPAATAVAVAASLSASAVIFHIRIRPALLLFSSLVFLLVLLLAHLLAVLLLFPWIVCHKKLIL